ncbi:MAG: LapA family protein [Rhodoferax sp.]|jgi:uncharacterized integral membrane protein
MKHIAWFFKWTLKAAIFFTLFAFALNNQHDATVRFFFGQQWTAPLVLVVLIAFALGLVIGVLGMVPRWWRHRRAAALARRTHEAAVTAEKPASPPPPPSQPPYGI